MLLSSSIVELVRPSTSIQLDIRRAADWKMLDSRTWFEGRLAYFGHLLELMFFGRLKESSTALLLRNSLL